MQHIDPLKVNDTQLIPYGPGQSHNQTQMYSLVTPVKMEEPSEFNPTIKSKPFSEISPRSQTLSKFEANDSVVITQELPVWGITSK